MAGDPKVSPEQERLVLEYLAEGKSDRVAMNRKLHDGFAHLKDATSKILHQFELHEQKDDLRFQQITDMVRGTNARLDKLEMAAEDTGRHNIVVLEEKLKERGQKTTQWAQFVAGAILSLAVMGIGAGLTVLLNKAVGGK